MVHNDYTANSFSKQQFGSRVHMTFVVKRIEIKLLVFFLPTASLVFAPEIFSNCILFII